MSKKSSTFAVAFVKKHVPLAQLVEQLTLNQWVEGSSPSGDTKRTGCIRTLFFSLSLFHHSFYPKFLELLLYLLLGHFVLNPFVSVFDLDFHLRRHFARRVHGRLPVLL